LTHLFDKFSENPKIAKNNENPKKYVFNIFALFLAFSMSSKTFHVSFLKSLIFLI